MQLEALECGAASLCMILAYYNKWIPLEQTREDCGISRDGSNARNVLKAARFYGLDAGTEYEVVNAIRDREITCIVIAHRLSTIRSCDEIIVIMIPCLMSSTIYHLR